MEGVLRRLVVLPIQYFIVRRLVVSPVQYLTIRRLVCCTTYTSHRPSARFFLPIQHLTSVSSFVMPFKLLAVVSTFVVSLTRLIVRRLVCYAI